MTTDATRATAEALPEISRRRFLLNTTMTGAAAAVAAVVTPAVAAEPDVHPLIRLHALHDEASKLMAAHNEYMGGEWELRIRAPHDPRPINYASIAAEPEMTPLEKAVWHLRELERLIMEDGGTEQTIVAVAKYDKDMKAISCGTMGAGRIRNDDGMFTLTVGAA